MSITFICGFLLALCISRASTDGDEKVFHNHNNKLIVPNIVHQTYDYQAPNFFLYLSIICVQRFLKPEKHILWVNDEGRYRKGHWDGWQHRAKEGSQTNWEYNLHSLMNTGKIEVKFLTFPGHPPGNESIFAPNKAHRSDFVRMSALKTMGGIYLDTDAFVISSLDELRIHNFSLSFDNIVNPDRKAPKRVNNGVLLSTPNSAFLNLWIKHYVNFNPNSFDYDSSVAPYEIATQYPDLVHIEMNRISPVSYGFHTSKLADAITCGILVPPTTVPNVGKDPLIPSEGAIWYPVWNVNTRSYTYHHTLPDTYMYAEVRKKLVLHLTMSQERGICMMRKHLSSPEDLNKMPSLLGRIFRIAHSGRDTFNYAELYTLSSSTSSSSLSSTSSSSSGVAERDSRLLSAWKQCRDHLGMHLTPDVDDRSRQQYTKLLE